MLGLAGERTANRFHRAISLLGTANDSFLLPLREPRNSARGLQKSHQVIRTAVETIE
jgi:hypothetical protein